MPLRKRTSSVLNGDPDRELKDPAGPASHDDAAALAGELAEAEAEAAEAEAALAVARARARALKLRRQAEAVAASAKVTAAAPPVPSPEPAPAVEPAPVVETAPPAERAVDEPADADLDDLDEVDYEEETAKRSRLKLPRARMPKLRPKVLVAALVVLVSVGFLGVGGWMNFQHRQATAQRQQSAELAAAARQGVVTMMSLNFNTASDDVKRIIDNTTGDFRRDFQGQADEFTKVAQASKVITEASVTATGVQSMTHNGGTVLVAVTTQVSNAASKQQEPRSWRLRVDMARDGGQLKLSKVEFVP